MELDYTPHEKSLLEYVRKGYKPKSCETPEEALRWRKQKYESYRNSAMSEEKVIEKIRDLEKSANEAAVRELYLVEKSSWHPVVKKKIKTDGTGINYTNLILALVFGYIFLSLGGMVYGGVIAYFFWLLSRWFSSRINR